MKTKEEVAIEINRIMADARTAAHNVLTDNQYDIGTTEELWRFLLPDDGKTMLTHAGMRVRNRCCMLAKLFSSFITNGSELKPKQLVSEAEIQAMHDKMTAKDKEFEKVKKTPEYKEYQRLFNKFKKYF